MHEDEIRDAGHDWLYDRDPPHDAIHEVMLWVGIMTIAIFLACACSGCKIPPGTTAQSSIFGIKINPLGQSPNAPQFVLGSSTQQFSTPVPADSGPSLNRSALEAPLGLRQTSTEALGPVGDQVKAGGETLVKTVEALHPASNAGTLVPFELPRPTPAADAAKK